MIETVDISKHCKIDYLDLLSQLRHIPVNDIYKPITIFKDYCIDIKIDKNKKYVIPIPRTHDIFSNLNFSYRKPDNYIDIKQLPYEINDKIKSYLFPLIKPEINLCIDNDIDKFSGNNIAEKSGKLYFKNDKVNTSIKLPIDKSNINSEIRDEIDNGLPLVNINYKSIFLTITSKYSFKLTMSMRGIMIDNSRQLLLTKNEPINYNNSTKLRIGFGFIVKTKDFT